MTETKVTGVRIPEEILAQIEKLEKAEGKSKTAVIVGLLRLGLGMEAGADTATVLERIEALEGKLLSCLTTGQTLNSVKQ